MRFVHVMVVVDTRATADIKNSLSAELVGDKSELSSQNQHFYFDGSEVGYRERRALHFADGWKRKHEV